MGPHKKKSVFLLGKQRLGSRLCNPIVSVKYSFPKYVNEFRQSLSVAQA